MTSRLKRTMGGVEVIKKQKFSKKNWYSNVPLCKSAVGSESQSPCLTLASPRNEFCWLHTLNLHVKFLKLCRWSLVLVDCSSKTYWSMGCGGFFKRNRKIFDSQNGSETRSQQCLKLQLNAWSKRSDQSFWMTKGEVGIFFPLDTGNV